jgi:hypothetical protein
MREDRGASRSLTERLSFVIIQHKQANTDTNPQRHAREFSSQFQHPTVHSLPKEKKLKTKSTNNHHPFRFLFLFFGLAFSILSAF